MIFWSLQSCLDRRLRLRSSAWLTGALLLVALSSPVSAALFADTFKPGTPYYFDSFDPGQQRWNPGQQLNIEEVFKNYQYYEILFDPKGSEIAVNRYVQGAKASSEKYRVLPDGSLRKE